MQGIYQKQPPPTQQKQKQKQKEQVVDMDVMKKLIEELERGQNSVHIVRSLILQHHPRIIMKVEEDTCENKNDDDNDDDKHDYIKALNHHSMVALDTYHNTMSMLRSCSNSSSSSSYVGSVKKRKLDRSSAHHHELISPINVNSTCKNSVVDDRRECDKKRKVSAKSREEEVTQLTYDGFSWRKYGQKIILNYHYPRHYYRCTHKYDQNCQATKQIQQLSNNPTKYKLMYHGSHTCNKNKMNDDDDGILETSPYIIDSPEEHPNSIVLNFDGSNQVNPSLFPASWDHLSSVDDMARATNDIVALNPISENNSCVTSPINIEEDEYYCYDNIMADFSQLSDLWTI